MANLKSCARERGSRRSLLDHLDMAAKTQNPFSATQPPFCKRIQPLAMGTDFQGGRTAVHCAALFRCRRSTFRPLMLCAVLFSADPAPLLRLGILAQPYFRSAPRFRTVSLPLLRLAAPVSAAEPLSACPSRFPWRQSFAESASGQIVPHARPREFTGCYGLSRHRSLCPDWQTVPACISRDW